MLPVKLEIKKLETTGNPLDDLIEWENININGKNYTRETDTLDTCGFILVFFAILFSKNNDYGFDERRNKILIAVDQYIGGVEHAILHYFTQDFL